MIYEIFSSFNILAILLGLLLLILYVSNKDKHVNLPPGPRGLPYFGNLLTLAKATHISRTLMEMAKVHGAVMSLRLGPQIGIVLTGYDIIKEALVDKAEYFSSRPDLALLRKYKRYKGLVHSMEWKEKRHLALRGMRDLGLGKKSLDDKIIEEAEMLGEELKASNGNSIDLHNLMPFVTTNVICSILRGERFTYDNTEMQKIVSAFKVVGAYTEISRTENFTSWAKYIPYMNIQRWDKVGAKYFERALPVAQGWIKDHMETYTSEHTRDLIDLFISEARKGNKNFKEDNIFYMIWDLLAAGTETTSTTLLWCIAYLIVHKDVQTKCRKEIHEVAGQGKIPEYSASRKLPYLNGVINEVQRMANIVPLALLHGTSGKAELRGYTIPKNSIVIVNLESALKDEKYWGDPYTFRPERWLDDDGQQIKNKAFVPFSIGKRECLGEQLAKKELFIFLTAMLQNFEFEMEDGTKPPYLGKGEGLVRGAPEYVVKVHQI